MIIGSLRDHLCLYLEEIDSFLESYDSRFAPSKEWSEGYRQAYEVVRGEVADMVELEFSDDSE